MSLVNKEAVMPSTAKKSGTRTRDAAAPGKTREAPVEEPAEKAASRAENSPDWRKTQKSKEAKAAREHLADRRVTHTTVTRDDIDGRAPLPVDRHDENAGVAPAPAPRREAP